MSIPLSTPCPAPVEGLWGQDGAQGSWGLPDKRPSVPCRQLSWLWGSASRWRPLPIVVGVRRGGQCPTGLCCSCHTPPHSYVSPHPENSRKQSFAKKASWCSGNLDLGDRNLQQPGLLHTQGRVCPLPTPGGGIGEPQLLSPWGEPDTEEDQLGLELEPPGKTPRRSPCPWAAGSKGADPAVGRCGARAPQPCLGLLGPQEPRPRRWMGSGVSTQVSLSIRVRETERSHLARGLDSGAGAC